ncbi:MAG: sensor histidine kinase [Bacillota bacterium]
MKKGIIRELINFYRNLSIRHKLLLLFYIQIIVPLLFIAFTSYQKSSEIIKHKSINYSQDIIRLIEHRFEDLDKNMNALTLELLYDNRVYETLRESGSKNDNISYFTNANQVRSILRQSTLSRNEIQSMCIVTKEKDYFCFDSNSAKATIEYMMPYEHMLARAREDDGKMAWYLDKKGDKIENVFIVRLVYDRDTFKEIGLISILIKKEFLESIYEDLSDESVNNILILSEYNEEIVNNYNNESVMPQSFIRSDLKGTSGYYIDSKDNFLVSYALLKNPKWKIVYHIPLQELYKEINTLRRWVIMIIVSSLIILSAFSLFTAFDIVEPIKRLVEAMKKLEKGSGHMDLHLNRADELGYLNESFNNMSKKIDFLVNRIYKEELTRKEAEIKALQAQINPHFLFNTLENINWMAQLNGVPEISETVSALASIIDANIGRDDKLITIREEFNYIENYISIIKSRYEDRLELDKHIDEAAMNVSIPRLLIQPIVENAVKHGIDKSRRNGIIELSVVKSGESVTICVSDNGVGMTDKELEELNSKLENDGNTYANGLGDHKKNSIGLENVNRRIKLFYGNGYGLKIESKYNEYTRVLVNIPSNINQEGESYYV